MYIFFGKNILNEKNVCYFGNFNGEIFFFKQMKFLRSFVSEGYIDDIFIVYDFGIVLKKRIFKRWFLKIIVLLFV